jgi:4-amino-4-deoxy-L-arabinose transferase-like glycosyltransferase
VLVHGTENQYVLFKHLYNIKTWILVFFLVRLIGITNPPLEVAHSWRQTTVTMVARNFFETDNSIFYPRIDIGGEKTGITGMEFPALNYLIYLISCVFGYAHWYGRLINLFVSSIGIWFFYKLLRNFYDEKLSFYSSAILLFSVWFNYSRKIMPDTFSVSLVIIGLHFCVQYLYNKHTWWHLAGYFVFALMGSLAKLPAGYLLILVPLFMYQNKTKTRALYLIFGSTAVVMMLCALYYYYWVPYLSRTFEFQHFFMGKSLFNGFIETVQNLDLVTEKFYLEALQIIGFVTFLLGIALAIKKSERRLLIPFLILFASFLIVIFKAGFVFYHHSYYIIPFAPAMALVAGYLISEIKQPKLALFILCLIVTENLLNKWNDYQIYPKDLKIETLEHEMNKYTKPTDLVLINSGNVPTPMYFAHRKGWVKSNGFISIKENIEELKRRGLKAIVILKKTFGEDIKLDYPILGDSEWYCIYKI